MAVPNQRQTAQALDQEARAGLPNTTTKQTTRGTDMTHIWIEKAKVEQALEALKADSMEVEKYGKAITDLEQAIATEDSSVAQEPVAWTDGDDLVLRQDWAERFDWQGSWVGVGRAIPNKWKPTLYTQPQPKATQEPVDAKLDGVLRRAIVRSGKVVHSPQRQPWVGLTDEEIWDLYNEPHNFAEMKSLIQAIEAKLKEKNT